MTVSVTPQIQGLFSVLLILACVEAKIIHVRIGSEFLASLISNDAKHLFMCLWPFWKFSLGKYPFKTYAFSRFGSTCSSDHWSGEMKKKKKPAFIEVPVSLSFCVTDTNQHITHWKMEKNKKTTTKYVQWMR